MDEVGTTLAVAGGPDPALNLQLGPTRYREGGTDLIQAKSLPAACLASWSRAYDLEESWFVIFCVQVDAVANLAK